MNFTDYILYRELVARIKCLPGPLEPVENEILAAVSQSLRVLDKEASLEQVVRKMLKLKDLGQINIMG